MFRAEAAAGRSMMHAPVLAMCRTTSCAIMSAMGGVRPVMATGLDWTS